MYNPQLGHSSNYHPTPSPANEVRPHAYSNSIEYQTSVPDEHQQKFAALYFLPNAIPGRQTRVKVPDNKFAMHTTVRSPRNIFSCLDIDTSQYRELVVVTTQATYYV
jgi:hypothetical protein